MGLILLQMNIELDFLRKSTFDLTGRQYENHKTVNKRIDKNLLYYGFYLQTKPFNSNSK
jgi:hypothetical protein